MSASLLRSGRSRTIVTVAAGLAGAAVLAACSSSGSGGTTPTSSTPTTGASSTVASGTDLSSVCPSTIKIQTSWYPNGDKGAIYNIVGPNGTMDTNNGTYSGTVDGVTVEILAGGPYVDNQSAISQMYSDSSIMFGEVSTDDAIESAGQHPVVAVVATMQKSPKAIVYDPATYDFKTLADVGKSGATILKSGEDASSDLLVASGDINSSQLDYSYDGSPGRFVTADGKDVIIDYGSEAPYQLEHLKEWGKPLKTILLANGGYTSYEDALTVTPTTESKYSACLKQFVPVMQKAFVDYAANPTPIGKVLVKYSAGLKNPQDVTLGSIMYSHKFEIDNGILANGTDGVAGSFNTARVTDLISRMSKLQGQLKTDISSSLKASDIVTNQFLDKKISFSKG